MSRTSCPYSYRTQRAVDARGPAAQARPWRRSSRSRSRERTAKRRVRRGSGRTRAARKSVRGSARSLTPWNQAAPREPSSEKLPPTLRMYRPDEECDHADHGDVHGGFGVGRAALDQHDDRRDRRRRHDDVLERTETGVDQHLGRREHREARNHQRDDYVRNEHEARDEGREQAARQQRRETELGAELRHPGACEQHRHSTDARQREVGWKGDAERQG